jgi:hypothetical protein
VVSIARQTWMVVSLLGASVMASPGAQANTLNSATFNFQSPAGVLGTTESYTVSGLTITAAGFSGSNFSIPNATLFDKTSGGDENGLGLKKAPDHEITAGSYIRIGLPANISAVSFTMDSSTAGEGWKVYGSNSPTGSLTLLLSGNGEQSHSLAVYPYYFFTATSGNVLLGSLTLVDPPPATTPLPGALPLFGAGLGAMGFLGWRRKRSTHAKA